MRSDEKILKRLENKALHYLGRYASTEARLRDVLSRFAQRKMEDEDLDHMRQMIDKMVLSCVEKGYVNDKLFAEQKTASLRRGGGSRLIISRKLLQRGVNRDVINDAINDFDDEHKRDDEHDAELEAALIYARKRRLGPYARLPLGKTEMKDGWQTRHYASFARAGFGGKTIKIVMSLDTAEDAERFLSGDRDIY